MKVSKIFDGLTVRSLRMQLYKQVEEYHGFEDPDAMSLFANNLNISAPRHLDQFVVGVFGLRRYRQEDVIVTITKDREYQKKKEEEEKAKKKLKLRVQLLAEAEKEAENGSENNAENALNSEAENETENEPEEEPENPGEKEADD